MRKPEPAPLAAAALSIRDVAEFTGFHPDTIRRRIADGTLPAFRIGPRAIRIRREDAEALLRPVPSAKVV